MEGGNVAVRELAHDGRLLQKLDSIVSRSSSLQQLDGHLPLAPGTLPHPLADSAKLAGPKVLRYPGRERERDSTEPQPMDGNLK